MDAFGRFDAAVMDAGLRYADSSDGTSIPSDDLESPIKVKQEEFSPCESEGAPSPPAALCTRGKGGYVCIGCQGSITDNFLLKVNGFTWHETCLRCDICRASLQSVDSCYLRDGLVFCRDDYFRKFTTGCAMCGGAIDPSDWVRKAADRLYHLKCFACVMCGVHMSTGERFGACQGLLYCEAHCLPMEFPVPANLSVPSPSPTLDHVSDGNLSTGCADASDSSTSSAKPSRKPRERGIKRKRMRTTFTENQQIYLQHEFDLNSNPIGERLDLICDVTSLEKRVVQVWFQNARARKRQREASMQLVS